MGFFCVWFWRYERNEADWNAEFFLAGWWWAILCYPCILGGGLYLDERTQSVIDIAAILRLHLALMEPTLSFPTASHDIPCGPSIWVASVKMSFPFSTPRIYKFALSIGHPGTMSCLTWPWEDILPTHQRSTRQGGWVVLHVHFLHLMAHHWGEMGTRNTTWKSCKTELHTVPHWEKCW